MKFESYGRLATVNGRLMKMTNHALKRLYIKRTQLKISQCGWEEMADTTGKVSDSMSVSSLVCMIPWCGNGVGKMSPVLQFMSLYSPEAGGRQSDALMRAYGLNSSWPFESTWVLISREFRDVCGYKSPTVAEITALRGFERRGQTPLQMQSEPRVSAPKSAPVTICPNADPDCIADCQLGSRRC
jgi:hypothetical protein